MLNAGSRFDLPFTCLDVTGAPVSPTGTPTAVLVHNGTDTVVSVTVTMSGAQGLASCTIPSSGVSAGDVFYLRVSAVISGTTYTLAGQPASIFSPTPIATAAAAAILATPENKLATNGSGQVAISNSIPTPPTASENGTAAATAILANPANKLATNGSGQVTISNSIPTPPTASENGTAAATAILATPANKLATNSSGQVDIAGVGSVEVTSLGSSAIAQLAGTVIRLAPTEQLESASLDLVQGTDYAAADGTDVRWTVDTPDDLTGSSAVLILKRGSESAEFEGTVSAVSGTIWRISIDITSSELSGLTTANDWTYAINLVLASTRVRSVRKPGQRARILSVT
jgi:hypothetical protein